MDSCFSERGKPYQVRSYISDPTSDPTTAPTIDPTTDPTIDPTSDPTADPTADPTLYVIYIYIYCRKVLHLSLSLTRQNVFFCFVCLCLYNKR